MKCDKVQDTATRSRKTQPCCLNVGRRYVDSYRRCNRVVTHGPFIFASLGPTAYDQVEHPHSKPARPYNLATGHFVGSGAGLCAIWILNTWESPNIL